MKERDALILLLVRTRRFSYEVIAQMMGAGCTRGVVAGVVFRDQHPKKKTIGTGKRMPTYRAATNKGNLRKVDSPRRVVIQAP